eukprot:Hpha_TRINITY_DN293_c0_g1::TRINITY_DN293_c0_g1_i1::g.83500::m.83500
MPGMPREGREGMREKGRRRRADSASGWLHVSAGLPPGATRRHPQGETHPSNNARMSTSPSPPPQPPSPSRQFSPPVPQFSPPLPDPPPPAVTSPPGALALAPFPPRDLGVGGVSGFDREQELLLRLEDERKFRVAAETSARNLADKVRLQEVEIRRLTDQLARRPEPPTGEQVHVRVGELQGTLAVCEEERRRAQAESLSARTEAEHTRQLRQEAETRCRTLEEELRNVGLTAEDGRFQLRRHASNLEQEVIALRARCDALSDELTALQASNKEWLRQFRRQRSELAGKTLECDWLRSVDTSDASLQDIGISRDDAAAIIDRLENTSARQRAALQTLGPVLPPPPVGSLGR